MARYNGKLISSRDYIRYGGATGRSDGVNNLKEVPNLINSYSYPVEFGPPGKPTLVSVALVDVGVASISFLAPEDDGGDTITGYKVTTFDTFGGGPTETTGATSPIQVSGLVFGHIYRFVVQAYNKYGLGPTSAASAPVVTAPQPPSCVTLLIVGGGGGAGDSNGSGGAGAGQLYHSCGVAICRNTTYTVTVGAGGAGTGESTRGQNGGVSSFIGTAVSICAVGGGGSGAEGQNQGAVGGSGGGGVRGGQGAVCATKPTAFHYGTPGGNPGGESGGYAGGSGGGAGQPGPPGSGTYAKPGGNGCFIAMYTVVSSFTSNTCGWLAGGGSSGNYQTFTLGPPGGCGGGGRSGGPANSPNCWRSGFCNTGGGGAAYGNRTGDGGTHPAGNGGSGIVVISYDATGDRSGFPTSCSGTVTRCFDFSNGLQHYVFTDTGSIRWDDPS